MTDSTKTATQRKDLLAKARQHKVDEKIPLLVHATLRWARKIDQKLYYFGSVDPALYGIDYIVPKNYHLEPGLVAISVSMYRMKYQLFDHGTLRLMGPIDEHSLGERVASIGNSIHVFRFGR